MSRTVRLLFFLALTAAVCLLGFDTLTRLRYFSHDSFFYMDAARHLAAGEGLSYRTYDFPEAERLADLDTPLPLVIWTPLYPLLVGAIHALGLQVADAAFVVTLLAYGFTLLFMFLLARETHGERLALLSTSLLTVNGSLIVVATYAWSETTAIAFAALGMWLVAREWREAPQPRGLLIAAGMAAGLSFATRYAMLPMIGFAGLAVMNLGDWRLTLRRWFLLSAGFLIVAAPVIARNILLSGHAMGWSHPASERGLLRNILELGSIFTVHLFAKDLVPGLLQFLVAWLLILGFLFALVVPSWRRRIGAIRRRCLGTAWWQGNRRVLTIWALGYFVYLLIYRSVYWVDPLGPRLGSPGMVPFMVPASAFVACAFRLSPRAVVRWAGAFTVLGLVLGLKLAGLPPRSDFEAEAALSERFAWVMEHTTERDLVIGDHQESVRFHEPERTVVNFYNWPLMDPPLDYARLMGVVNRHCGKYDRVFFVVEDWTHKGDKENKRLRAERGPLVTDIVEQKWKQYPALEYVTRVKGAYVFRVKCGVEAARQDRP